MTLIMPLKIFLIYLWSLLLINSVNHNAKNAFCNLRVTDLQCLELFVWLLLNNPIQIPAVIRWQINTKRLCFIALPVGEMTENGGITS